ncbi:MAG: DNA polymerase III subunit alpha, partial [Chitinispirillaceae bacterium]|nr:DNA polymerase III subunit alpha [Chitinispirillaceae bacterium]
MLPLLNAVSSYSLLRGVHSPEAICRTAAELGYRIISITDRNNLYGYPLFIDACRRFGLKPLAGAEIDDKSGDSALVYADGPDGFSSLCSLVSERQLSESFSLAEALCVYGSGIVAVSESRALFDRCDDRVTLFYRQWRLRRFPEWVRKREIPAIIAPPAVFLNPDDIATHRMLRAIDTGSTLSRLREEDLFPDTALLQSPQMIAERFEVFDTAIAHTEAFADKVAASTTPETCIMPEVQQSERSAEILRECTMAGALWRYGTLDDRITGRIDHELELIVSKRFAGYFLIVDDIVRQSPRTCGRGSGAASIVAYSLGITNVDPIRYNLMFERFLNASRSDPPDIDIDFAWDERDGVLDYVFRKYGNDHAAMVATHQTCGARMAIREVARVYGRTEHEISAVTKKIPWFADLQSYSDDLETLLAAWPGLKEIPLDEPWPAILKDAGKIIGLPRGIGTHCGGVVITGCPIRSVAPLQRSAKGYQILQWEKDGTEAMGLVKIDLLGNRSLAVIRDAVRSVKKEFPDFDETRIDPQSDPATIELLAKGATMGVFYVESPAMRLLQRKSRRGDFEHLVIHSSIIRPAANKYIREYLHRLNGKPYRPLHPLIGKALEESYGIMVYQEDV